MVALLDLQAEPLLSRGAESLLPGQKFVQICAGEFSNRMG